MGSKIAKIEYYLPEQILDNKRLSEDFPDWTPEKIEQKIGIRERHIVGENETSLDLAYKAGEKVLSGTNVKEIDFLLLCTQSPDYFLPTSACILQDSLKLRTNIGAFDYNLGCSGYIYGLAIAKSLINSGIARKVLLIMSETYSKYIHAKDKANKTLFGDAAAATLIEYDEVECIHEFQLGTDGQGMNNLIVPNGGMRHRYDPHCEEVADGSGSIRTANNLFMNGPEIFNFTIRNIPPLITEVLQKNNETIETIDYIIFHQANKYMLDYLRQKMKIPPEKFFNNMLETGNTVSATIPIGICKAKENGLIHKGSRILLCGFGVGYSWGATVITL